MTENNANNIDGAFEMLLEEVEAERTFCMEKPYDVLSWIKKERPGNKS